VIALSKQRAAAYKSPKDLAGLTIGVTAPGSSSALALSLLMAKENLTADQIAVIGVGAGNQAIATMKSGRLDGESNFDPVITKLIADGEGLDYLYGGPYAGSAISTTPGFIKTNPHTVQAFVNGMVKALRWLRKASVDDIADSLPPEYYAGDKDIYKKSLQANVAMLSKDGIVTQALGEATYRMIAWANEDVRKATIDIGKTYDASFAVKASKAIP